MVLPLRTLASSNGCKTQQSDWCAHCQHINTSHRYWYVFTGCRLNKFRINFKIAMLCFKCIHGRAPAKAWLPSRRLGHTTSARTPVSSSKTIHDVDDRKKRLATQPFPMHPPRFRTVSHNHYSHSKILTPLSIALSHCLNLTILEKRLILFIFFSVSYSIYFRILL